MLFFKSADLYFLFFVYSLTFYADFFWHAEKLAKV
jgi:hypothetical protein